MKKYTKFQLAVLAAKITELKENGETLGPRALLEMALANCATIVKWSPVRKDSDVPPQLWPVLTMPTPWTDHEVQRFKDIAGDIIRNDPAMAVHDVNSKTLELLHQEGIHKVSSKRTHALVREARAAVSKGTPISGSMRKINGKWVIQLRLPGGELVTHTEVDVNLTEAQALELPTLYAAARNFAAPEPPPVAPTPLKREKAIPVQKQKVVVFGLLPAQAEVLRSDCPEEIALNCVKSMKALSRKISGDTILVQMIRFSPHISWDIKGSFQEYIPLNGGVHGAKQTLIEIANQSKRASA